MRKIDKSPNIPATLVDAPIPTSPAKVKKDIYKADDVRKQLLEDQHNKCAYCESRIPKEYNDVEHYRPRSKYYWLGHDWNNLLYSCPLCNRSYKNDDFPLLNEANRVTEPGGNLAIEEPLIINPSIDEPTLHIRFNRHIMVGITAKGKKTIEMFHLNEREVLVQDREILYESYKRKKEQIEKMQKLLKSPNLTDDFRPYINDTITFLMKSIDQDRALDKPHSGILVNQ